MQKPLLFSSLMFCLISSKDLKMFTSNIKQLKTQMNKFHINDIFFIKRTKYAFSYRFCPRHEKVSSLIKIHTLAKTFILKLHIHNIPCKCVMHAIYVSSVY